MICNGASPTADLVELELRFASLALGRRKSGLPDLRAYERRSRAGPRSVSFFARARALASVARDTRQACPGQASARERRSGTQGPHPGTQGPHGDTLADAALTIT